MKIAVDIVRFRVKPAKDIEVYRGLYDPLVQRTHVKGMGNVFDVDDSEWRKAYQVPDFVIQIFRSNDPKQDDTLLIECTDYEPMKLQHWLNENF